MHSKKLNIHVAAAHKIYPQAYKIQPYLYDDNNNTSFHFKKYIFMKK